MTQLFSDAARGYLATAIGANDTSITLSGLGNLFKTVVAPDIFKAVLQDINGFEIVYCVAHANASDTFILLRGQEGTTARAFAPGSIFGQRVTALDMARLRDSYDQQTITADTVLDANTEYVTGSGLRIANGSNLRIPATTKLTVKNFNACKKL